MCGEHSQCSCHAGCARAHGCVLSPSTLLRLQPALQGTGPELCVLPRPKPLRFRFSGTPQKCRLGWACVLCLPRLSCSGSQELDGRTLPWCGAPYPLCGPSLSFRKTQLGACTLCLFSGAGLSPRPSQQMSTIQNLRKSLVRNWRPVCSLIGDTPLGPSLPLSPPPCLLPLAGDGPSATG